MKKTIRMLSAVALAGGLTVAVAGSSYAQDQAGAAGPVAGPAGAAGHWDPARMRARLQQRRQRRAQVLHDALGLRPDQEGAWRTLLTSVRAPAGDRLERRMRRAGEHHAPLNTPERLDRISQRMNAREARFQQRARAIKAFYATLDPRQQKTFDAVAGARLMGLRAGRMHRFALHRGLMRG